MSITPPDAPAPRRRLHADDRRVLVVAAAVEEFAAHGYEAGTTAGVAARAGVSQPYVVRLFGGKRALFLDALAESHGRIERAFRAAAEGGPPAVEKLRPMGDAFQAMLDADDAGMRCLLHGFAAARDDAEIARCVRAGYGDLVALVEELTGAAPVEVLGFFAMGMFLTVAAVAGLPAGAADGDERLARLLEALHES